MEDKYKQQLIEFLKEISAASDEFINSLLWAVNQKKVRKGTVINESGTVGISSRFLCVGIIGLYQEKDGGASLEHLFGESDIVREFHSYYTGKPSPYFLLAMSDAVFLQIDRGQEGIQIRRSPELLEVDNALYQYILQRRTKLNAIRVAGLEKGVEQLNDFLPGAYQLLKLKDLTSFFNCSISTVSRWKRDTKDK